MRKFYPVISTIYDDGRASVVIGTPEEHENRPKDTYTNTSRRIYTLIGSTAWQKPGSL